MKHVDRTSGLPDFGVGVALRCNTYCLCAERSIGAQAVATTPGSHSMDIPPIVDEAVAGPPLAKRSRLAVEIERWCIVGSWAMCKHSRILQPVDTTPTCLDRAPTPLISDKKCWRCRDHRQHLVPTFDDLPAPFKTPHAEYRRCSRCRRGRRRTRGAIAHQQWISTARSDDSVCMACYVASDTLESPHCSTTSCR